MHVGEEKIYEVFISNRKTRIKICSIIVILYDGGIYLFNQPIFESFVLPPATFFFLFDPASMCMFIGK